jgi:uncharacterized SAM-binding protein YcdF (DUF218 family)
MDPPPPIVSPGGRLLVVLGYSDGGRGRLHPVCARRLAHAARVSTPSDVVVLSGWARVPGTRPEAELMAEAWSGPARELVADPTARTTVGNATNALDDIRRARPSLVVVVTSRWHAPRAAAAFRWRLRGTGIRVATTSPREPRSIRASLSEVLLWLALPIQLATKAY